MLKRDIHVERQLRQMHTSRGATYRIVNPSHRGVGMFCHVSAATTATEGPEDAAWNVRYL